MIKQIKNILTEHIKRLGIEQQSLENILPSSEQ